MKRIDNRGTAVEACVTKAGTLVGPRMTELVGFKQLTPYRGGWCGNEIFPDAFDQGIRDKCRAYTERFGDQLGQGQTGRLADHSFTATLAPGLAGRSTPLPLGLGRFPLSLGQLHSMFAGQLPNGLPSRASTFGR